MKIRFTAETPFERAKGLMYSKPLSDDEIAVFKFDTDSTAGFWNKNVSYPIRIIFFDKNFNVVGMQELSAEQTSLVHSLKPYRYAIETSIDDKDSQSLIDIKQYLIDTYGNKL